MRIKNVGHIGHLIETSDLRLVIDPLFRSEDCFAPSNDASASCADVVVLTSRSPLHSHAPSVSRCRGPRLVGDASSLSYCRGAKEAFVVTSSLRPSFSLEGLDLTFFPSSWGAENSVLVCTSEEAVWFQGDSISSAEQCRRVRQFAGARRCTAVLSAYVDHLSDVLRGRCRGFPYRRVQERILQAKNLAAAGWGRIQLAGGVHFHGAASWMNAFCQPLLECALAADIRSCLTASALHAVVQTSGAEERSEWFDPTVAMHPIPAIGEASESEALLQASLARACAESWWATFAAGCQVWQPTFAFRVYGDDGTRELLLRLGGPEPIVEADPVESASIYVATSARALREILSGRWRAEHAALNGELRTSERLFQIRGGAVRRPIWIGQRSTDVRAERACYLPDPWLVLELFGGHPIPAIEWATGET